MSKSKGGMIDKIKIYFPNSVFCGKTDCWKKIKENRYTETYKYARKSLSHPHPLILEFNKGKKHITIMGSLRKWLLGETSLVDLTERSMNRIAVLLADSLNMPLTEFLKGKITQCEIGLNVRTKISPLKILPNIVAYKSFPRDDSYELDGTVYFGTKNSSREIVIYDKSKEIISHYQGKDFETIQNVQNALAKRGYHFLRIEIRLPNQKSFKHLHFYQIKYFGDILSYWKELYFLWVSEMKELIYYSGIKLSKEMDVNEYKTADMLQKDSYYSVMKNIEKYCHSKTAKGLKSKRYKERKLVKSVIEKYGNRKSYNAYTLKTDIAKTLLLIKRKENINLLFLYKALWSVQK